MKKICVIFISVFFVVSSLFLSSVASAHVLQTDGDIGAVLHIEPDDNPLAGEKTTYQLSFSGVKAFSLSACDCLVSYSTNDKMLKQERLTTVSQLSSKNSFTFQTPGVYTITVHGTPKQQGVFTPFTLQYTIRVAQPNQLNTQPFPISLGIAFGLLTLLLLLVAVKADGMLERPE